MHIYTHTLLHRYICTSPYRYIICTTQINTHWYTPVTNKHSPIIHSTQRYTLSNTHSAIHTQRYTLTNTHSPIHTQHQYTLTNTQHSQIIHTHWSYTLIDHTHFLFCCCRHFVSLFCQMIVLSCGFLKQKSLQLPRTYNYNTMVHIVIVE